MAIDLLNRFTSGQVNNVTSVKSGSVAVSDSAEAARIVRSIYAMKAGDTLQGELVSAKGTDISLLLGETVTLNAKLDKELSLTPGQLMSFTVNSNKNGKLSLSPLFANTGMEENAVKALDAAGIPVSEKTLAMAEELMKQGMPINKQTLSTVYRQLNMYPDAEVSDIVMMNKMNIPVTDENVSMMRLYQTNQQYMFSDLQGLSSQITNLLSEMTANGQTDSAAAFIKGFLQIFTSSQEMASIGQQEVNASLTPVTEGMATNADGLPKMELNITEDVSQTITSDGKVIISEKQTGEFSGQNTLVQGNSDSQEAEITQLLKNDALKTEDGRNALTQNLFTFLKNQMLMKPEDITSAEYVKEYYEQLDGQMDKLKDLLKSVGKEDSALSKEAGNIKSNIQFMNQINELYHYVQLPIKMNNAEAKGDLYVYKRKHAKTSDDGKLTALLHLSMPTLGNMDVFLSLEEQKLSTRFCMEKEEMIDFIESHIDELNVRLMKKGYQVQTNVTSASKEEKNVIETILDSELPIPIMTSQSFDARC